jgi:cytoskeletal protein RodZ
VGKLLLVLGRWKLLVGILLAEAVVAGAVLTVIVFANPSFGNPPPGLPRPNPQPTRIRGRTATPEEPTQMPEPTEISFMSATPHPSTATPVPTTTSPHPTATAESPTATTVPPTATSVPPSATPSSEPTTTPNPNCRAEDFSNFSGILVNGLTVSASADNVTGGLGLYVDDVQVDEGINFGSVSWTAPSAGTYDIRVMWEVAQTNCGEPWIWEETVTLP